jgi:phage terminase small subunit
MAGKKAPEGGKQINCQLPGADMLADGKSVGEIMEALQDDLSPEHDRFCREFILDDNQTRAYMRAYPDSSYGAAAVSAHHLLKNPKICQRIDALRDERNKRLEISADKVLKRLEARASVTLRDLYKPDGSFIPIHELDPDVAIGIKSVEVVELFEGQGESKQAIGLLRKITMLDGKASDELIGRNLNMWKDVGSKDNPLTVDKLSDEALEARLAALESKES